MDEKTKAEIAKQVDMVLAFQGEDVTAEAVHDAVMKELGSGDFAEWPEKRGAQVEFVEQLATVVLEQLQGHKMPEAKKTGAGAGVVNEGWDEGTEGAPIIRTPIG